MLPHTAILRSPFNAARLLLAVASASFAMGVSAQNYTLRLYPGVAGDYAMTFTGLTEQGDVLGYRRNYAVDKQRALGIVWSGEVAGYVGGGYGFVPLAKSESGKLVGNFETYEYVTRYDDYIVSAYSPVIFQDENKTQLWDSHGKASWSMAFDPAGNVYGNQGSALVKWTSGGIRTLADDFLMSGFAKGAWLVGYSGGNFFIPAVMHKGVVSNLDQTGYERCFPSGGINSHGVAIGNCFYGSYDSHPVKWDGGTRTDLPGLAGLGYSYVSGINAQGQMIGRTGVHPVLWWNDKVLDMTHRFQNKIENSGWQVKQLLKINSSGVIVAIAYHPAANSTRVALLIPE